VSLGCFAGGDIGAVLTTMSPMLRKLLHSFLYLVFICVCVEVGLQGFYYFTAGDFLFSRVGIPIYSREPYAGFGNRPATGRVVPQPSGERSA
jgi:hypothetical protein